MGRRRTAFGIALVGVTASCSGASTTDSTSVTTGQAQSRSDAAEDILRRMGDLYAHTKTYRDEGTIHSTLVPSPGGGVPDQESSSTFRTLWVAPDRLRFDFQQAHTLHVRLPSPDGGATEYVSPPLTSTFVIWAHDGTAKAWALGSVDEYTCADTDALDQALHALQGVTERATGLAPRFLHDRGVTHSGSWELHGRTACGGSTCFEIVRVRDNEMATMLIDTATYALRGYSSHATFGRDTLQVPWPPGTQRSGASIANASSPAGIAAAVVQPFEADETMTLEPVFDGPIDPGSFEFTPPTN